MIGRLAIAAALTALLGTVPISGAGAQDGETLPDGNGSELVEAYCAACHSLKIVTQQGMSRDRWDETLRWMVEEQEMPPIEAGDRAIILDYLSRHFGEDRKRYRPPQPPL